MLRGRPWQRSANVCSGVNRYRNAMFDIGPVHPRTRTLPGAVRTSHLCQRQRGSRVLGGSRYANVMTRKTAFKSFGKEAPDARHASGNPRAYFFCAMYFCSMDGLV